ncbi:DUF6804 family protein [Neomicrococcus lactis]|uniref:DUF6804 family protein n=1 Tax=Neomicrococcus lactis TaxID=732241 RepID=UPI002FDFC307
MTRPALIPGIVASVFLLYALGSQPYGYYNFMRWIVTIAAVVVSFLAAKNEQKGWLWFSVPTALLFNPISPNYMSKDEWVIYDVLAAAGSIWAGLQISKQNE